MGRPPFQPDDFIDTERLQRSAECCFQIGSFLTVTALTLMTAYVPLFQTILGTEPIGLAGALAFAAATNVPLTNNRIIEHRIAATGGTVYYGDDEVERLARIFMSPGPIFDPQGDVDDFWRFRHGLAAAGFRPGEIVQNAASYHLTSLGFMLDAVNSCGAELRTACFFFGERWKGLRRAGVPVESIPEDRWCELFQATHSLPQLREAREIGTTVCPTGNGASR